MKVKLSPVLSIFIIYICLSAYLIFSYFNLQQRLSGVGVVNLTPVAYGLLILGSVFLALSLFSLFRIPIFHYLFKMLHLWVVIVSGLILWFYFKHGNMLSNMFNTDTQQSIAKNFQVAQPDLFIPLFSLIQHALINFREHVIYLYFALTIILAIVQLILYMPASLRYVYHTHISPVKYTIKHIFVSVLLLVPLLYAANYFFKLDYSLNPDLENLLADKQHDIKDTDNVFFPILTLWLSDLSDSIAYGNQWMTEHKRMLDYFQKLNKPVNPLEYPGYRKLLLSGMSKEDQAVINQLYIKRLLKNEPEIEADILSYANKYQTPLKMTRSFYDYGNYKNPVNYTDRSYTEFYSDYTESLLSLQRLYLLDSLIKHRANVKALIKDISDDYMYNIRMIRTSTDPHVKLLHIKKEIIIAQFLYNLLQHPEFQHDQIYHFISQLPFLVKEVTDQKLIAQKNILLVKHQLDLANQTLTSSQSNPAKIIDYTFKYNKTLNCIYAHATAEYNLDDREISLHLKRQKTDTSKASLDNVIGNIICNANISSGENDIYVRAVEANGGLMILKARSKLYEDKINDLNVAAYLTNRSGDYFNPFTGAALQWDRDAKQIYFEYNDGIHNVKISH